MRLVNLISKDANLVYFLSVCPLSTLQNDDYDVIIDFRVNLTSSTSLKNCNDMST